MLDKRAIVVYTDGMDTQNQIKRALSQPESIEQVRALLVANPGLSRTQIADLVCELFAFHDLRGERQRGGCLKALRRLEAAGAFQLPARLIDHARNYSPRRLDQPVPVPEGVPERVDGIRQLELIRVVTDEQRRIWNELMVGDHPQGHRRLVGRQLRYLVRSEQGWLGGLGFGASALNLHDRDRWIGWDRETRAAHLDQVVGLSRFLIRPQVNCQNLASRVLGLGVQAFRKDFAEVYGYAPLLLETFVDTTRFSGTCFRAANWLRVGQTQGRGRQDRTNQAPETRKEIYVYPLVADFRSRLGLPADAGQQPLAPAEGLEADHWAHNEFGTAPLGDLRRTRRVESIVQAKAERPGCSWLEVAGGDKAAIKGYYTLLSLPADEPLTLPNLLHTHRERTLRRMAAQSRVLCIQDATDLDYSGLEQCQGLGVIGKNQTGTQSKGLRLHSTFVLTDTGLPLGVLRAECYAPALKPELRGQDRRYLPLEDKDTFRWAEGLRDCQECSVDLPGTQVLCVMDREADFFELFDRWREQPRVDLLVRAKHDRRTNGEGTLFDWVRCTPVQTTMSIEIQRLSPRTKKGRRPAAPARPPRTALVSVRSQPVPLSPPRHGLNAAKKPVPVWLIQVREEHPPHDQMPLEWFLLTTRELDSPEQAVACVRWYALRWRVEDWHKVIKSVCRTEAATHRTAERLRRVLAMDMVIAWRLLLMTLLGRDTPDLPPEVLFTEIELQVLRHYAEKRGSASRTHSATQ